MQTIKLHSWLSEQISRFIELRRLSGTDYSSQTRLLGYFDRFLAEQYPNGSFVTRHIIDHYLQSLSHLRPRVRLNRYCVVRQLCRYIAQTEPRCHVPEPMRALPPQRFSTLISSANRKSRPCSRRLRHCRHRSRCGRTPITFFWAFCIQPAFGSGKPLL